MYVSLQVRSAVCGGGGFEVFFFAGSDKDLLSSKAHHLSTLVPDTYRRPFEGVAERATLILLDADT